MSILFEKAAGIIAPGCLLFALKEDAMLIKRQNANGQVEVTFRIALDGIDRLSLLGDFNHWNPTAHPLMRDAEGLWCGTVTLPDGEYRYRYIANGVDWLNDPQADGYVPNQFGGENSVARVEYALAEPPAPAPKKKRAPAKPKAAKIEGEAAPKKRASRKKSAA